jgi:hypothetical protein
MQCNVLVIFTSEETYCKACQSKPSETDQYYTKTVSPNIPVQIVRKWRIISFVFMHRCQNAYCLHFDTMPIPLLQPKNIGIFERVMNHADCTEMAQVGKRLRIDCRGMESKISKIKNDKYNGTEKQLLAFRTFTLLKNHSHSF